MNPKNTQIILRKLRRLYPRAKTALEHHNPFELLIATILSAQCTDKRVNMVTPALFQKAPTPEKMLQLGQKDLEKFVATCGLYQSKSKNILGACRVLLEKFGGKVPKTMEEMTQLPGVGRKTANVVLFNAFGIPGIAVDTHVFRVSQRLGLAKGKTPEQIERQLMEKYPKKNWGELSHVLILHGRALCQARRPLCEKCPLTGECSYYQKYFLDKIARGEKAIQQGRFVTHARAKRKMKRWL